MNDAACDCGLLSPYPYCDKSLVQEDTVPPRIETSGYGNLVQTTALPGPCRLATEPLKLP